ncbi:MAG: hypothetical protein ACTH90_01910, partial [Leuconostoc mesenteroides]
LKLGLKKKSDIANSSIAIQKQMTIDELAMSDFFFQPNFSQPINYIPEVALAAVAEKQALTLAY